MKTRTVTLRRLIRTVGGLAVFSLGTSLTIKANIGLAPWEALSLGLSNVSGISYGFVHSGIGLAILALDLIMKEKIGFGTVFDALLVGVMTDFFLRLNPMSYQTQLVSGLSVMVIGLAIVAFGQYLYMSSGEGCGPRDAFLLGVGKRFSRVPIGVVNTVILGTVFILSLLLKAPLGIGTIIASFGMGPIMQLEFSLLHFEPRDVAHENIVQAAASLIISKTY